MKNFILLFFFALIAATSSYAGVVCGLPGTKAISRGPASVNEKCDTAKELMAPNISGAQFKGICKEIVKSDPMCKKLDPSKRMTCSSKEQNSLENISNSQVGKRALACLKGFFWDSTVELVKFLGQMIKALFNMNMETAADIGRFMMNVPKYAAQGGIAAVKAAPGAAKKAGNLGQAFIHNSYQYVARDFPAAAAKHGPVKALEVTMGRPLLNFMLDTTESIARFFNPEYDCMSGVAKVGTVCKVFGEFIMPPTVFFTAVKYGPKGLKALNKHPKVKSFQTKFAEINHNRAVKKYNRAADKHRSASKARERAVVQMYEELEKNPKSLQSKKAFLKAIVAESRHYSAQNKASRAQSASITSIQNLELARNREIIAKASQVLAQTEKKTKHLKENLSDATLVDLVQVGRREAAIVKFEDMITKSDGAGTHGKKSVSRHWNSIKGMDEASAKEQLSFLRELEAKPFDAKNPDETLTGLLESGELDSLVSKKFKDDYFSALKKFRENTGDSKLAEDLQFQHERVLTRATNILESKVRRFDTIRKNSELAPDVRTTEAARVLNKDLSENQKKAILAAHEVGASRGVGKYTQADITNKARLLKEAGFTTPEIRRLMEDGITGSIDDSVVAMSSGGQNTFIGLDGSIRQFNADELSSEVIRLKAGNFFPFTYLDSASTVSRIDKGDLRSEFRIQVGDDNKTRLIYTVSHFGTKPSKKYDDIRGALIERTSSFRRGNIGTDYHQGLGGWPDPSRTESTFNFVIDDMSEDQIRSMFSSFTDFENLKPNRQAILDVNQMGTLPNETRTSVAHLLLGRSKSFSETEKRALLEAHAVGEGAGRGIGSYTRIEIAQKAKILKEAGFSPWEIRKLMENGIAGSANPKAVKSTSGLKDFVASDALKGALSDESRSVESVIKEFYPDLIGPDAHRLTEARLKMKEELEVALKQAGTVDNFGLIVKRYLDIQAFLRPQMKVSASGRPGVVTFKGNHTKGKSPWMPHLIQASAKSAFKMDPGQSFKLQIARQPNSTFGITVEGLSPESAGLILKEIEKHGDDIAHFFHHSQNHKQLNFEIGKDASGKILVGDDLYKESSRSTIPRIRKQKASEGLLSSADALRLSDQMDNLTESPSNLALVIDLLDDYKLARSNAGVQYQAAGDLSQSARNFIQAGEVDKAVSVLNQRVRKGDISDAKLDAEISARVQELEKEIKRFSGADRSPARELELETLKKVISGLEKSRRMTPGLLKASDYTPEQRISAAKKTTGKDLTRRQEQAIQKAHEVGTLEGRGYFEYTPADLLQKGRILKEAGFDQKEIRKLMEEGITGSASKLPLPGSRDAFDSLAKSLTDTNRGGDIQIMLDQVYKLSYKTDELAEDIRKGTFEDLLKNDKTLRKATEKYLVEADAYKVLDQGPSSSEVREEARKKLWASYNDLVEGYTRKAGATWSDKGPHPLVAAHSSYDTVRAASGIKNFSRMNETEKSSFLQFVRSENSVARANSQKQLEAADRLLRDAFPSKYWEYNELKGPLSADDVKQFSDDLARANPRIVQGELAHEQTAFLEAVQRHSDELNAGTVPAELDQLTRKTASSVRRQGLRVEELSKRNLNYLDQLDGKLDPEVLNKMSAKERKAVADGLLKAGYGNRKLSDAAALSNEGRIFKAEEYLDRNLNDLQKKALIEAHEVGLAQGRGFGTYTNDDIVKKGLILKNAGFKAPEIRKLMEEGITGWSGRGVTSGRRPGVATSFQSSRFSDIQSQMTVATPASPVKVHMHVLESGKHADLQSALSELGLPTNRRGFNLETSYGAFGVWDVSVKSQEEATKVKQILDQFADSIGEARTTQNGNPVRVTAPPAPRPEPARNPLPEGWE